jgi:tetratricopeptide (TPR) repeat protein
MKKILLSCGAVMALLVLAPAPAQQVSIPPLMETLKGERAIQLQSLHISVQARGGLAETTVRMRFFNPNSRPLEGNLQFPLLDGQQVSGFSLDFDGRMRPAVPVAKSKGQEVFEDIERRNVDPALLEKTQGNNFRLRVYPIPARGTRDVEVRYTEALADVNGRRRYRLPLDYAGKLQEFALEVASDSPGRPVASGAIGGLDFQRRDGLYRAQVSRTSFAPSGTLELLLAKPGQAQSSVQAVGGDLYFVAEIPVSATRHPRTLPRKLGLLWDSSMSGESRPHAAEFALLDRYFRTLGDGEVRLQRLRDRPEAPRDFPIRDGDWSALRHELEGTVYDGASALADWKPQAGVGEYLLFSDGLLNYGPLAFAETPGQRLYAINSSNSADRDRLRAVAEASGGALVELDASRIETSAAQLLGEGSIVSSFESTGLADVQRAPGDGGDGFLRYAGRLTAPDASLSVHFADGSTSQVKIFDRDPQNPFAAWQWANYRLAALAASPELKRAEVARIGTRFGIATSETSLIVLDRVEDYAEHEIAPPPELADAYAKLRQEHESKAAKSRQQHLDGVVDEFKARIAWWEKEFPKGTPPPEDRSRKSAPGDASLASVAVMAAPAGAPPPPPPPPAPSGAPMVDVTATDTRSVLTNEQIERLPLGHSAEAIALLAPGAVQPTVTGGAQAAPAATIKIKGWQADAPYVARLRAAKPADVYAVYLDERPTWRSSSGFYVDVADLLIERGQKDLALRVLSNLAEMELENRQILRVLGYRLMQAGEPVLAVPVFEKVRSLAEYEPQSWRDLGNAYAAAGRPQDAIDALTEVVMRDWDGRFDEIELVALAELNSLAAAGKGRLNVDRLDERLRRNLPVDLRVVLAWDANDSDVDLWVTDPNGEKCYYQHQDTYQGGHLTDDFTGGYGPEEFSLRVAKKGRYRVEANYYGDTQQTVAGPTTLQLRFTTKFGTEAAKEQLVMLRLKENKETVLVGEFVVD